MSLLKTHRGLLVSCTTVLALTAAAVALTTVLGGRSTNRGELLQLGQNQLRLAELPRTSLAMTYRNLLDAEIPPSGRCRCVGVDGRDPQQRVVCACTGKDDVWNKGPWKVVTGYTVVYDKKEEDPHDFGKYVTIQAIGYPEGPKGPAHYYTLIQPYDDLGLPTMPEVYPDGPLGVGPDAYFEFETPKPKGMAFADRGAPKLAGYYDMGAAISAAPALANLFHQ